MSPLAVVRFHTISFRKFSGPNRLLEENADGLDAQLILMIFAENPRGATAFTDLKTQPPASELEFVNLWKLYLLTLRTSKKIGILLDDTLGVPYGVKS